MYDEEIEKLQVRANKLINKLSIVTNEERLVKLGIPTFKGRRLRREMMYVYKLVHGVYNNLSSDEFNLYSLI
jgi:hypothetical protein